MQALRALEVLAQQLRDLIASMPPKELLGYVYATLVLGLGKGRASLDEEVPEPDTSPKQNLDAAQFLLEYVHAVFATTPTSIDSKWDESVCAEIIRVAEELKNSSLMIAMMIAARSSEAQFGANTKTLLFHALSTWVLMRGHRYQMLEEEFFIFALDPHDDALRRTYGIGAQEIAAGIQASADAVRLGHDQAARALMRSIEDAQRYVASRDQSVKEGMAQWMTERTEPAKAAGAAFDDLFQGGICNVSRHTRLPTSLLDDLSYEVAEEAEFFGPGTYSGTPFRTLPARKKPFIKLDGEHYLTDPSFARDAAYRGILHNLLIRDLGYADEFKNKQKEWSESAFANVFNGQLAGAKILREVYYRRNGNWFENDTLILLDGVLVLVEAKSGAAATIASPASNFDRHARAMRDLIVKAYDQCRRFLDYLASADEVPLFAFNDGRYEEVIRVRLSDYWLILPIGLTVESFSPFSTNSKQLPEVTPILGKHPFISVAIDELLVLNRFLPGTGALIHYLRIRQEAAGIKKLFLFDEFDHLGAYITKNRFCDALLPPEATEADLVVADGMSSVVDGYFSQRDWVQTAPPAQAFPEELQSVLASLAHTRAPGWIEADSLLRDLGLEGRIDVAGALEPLRKSLRRQPRRYFALRLGEVGLLFWIHRDGDAAEIETAKLKAQAVAESVDVERVLLIIVGVDARGHYSRAAPHWIQRTLEASAAVHADAAALSRRAINPAASPAMAEHPPHKPGRNEPCWCGSGTKFKKCHGR
ncbi:hypothetical protein ASD05_14405 [Variovorax sp. Root434]|nr:hypothetical protein ASD05_14405 [Variovorax sp. Root434]